MPRVIDSVVSIDLVRQLLVKRVPVLGVARRLHPCRSIRDKSEHGV